MASSSSDPIMETRPHREGGGAAGQWGSEEGVGSSVHTGGEAPSHCCGSHQSLRFCPPPVFGTSVCRHFVIELFPPLLVSSLWPRRKQPLQDTNGKGSSRLRRRFSTRTWRGLLWIRCSASSFPNHALINCLFVCLDKGNAWFVSCELGELGAGHDSKNLF